MGLGGLISISLWLLDIERPLPFSVVGVTVGIIAFFVTNKEHKEEE